jgi:hypothetical protein
MTNPVNVGIASEEKLCHLPLATMAGTPEGACNRISGRRLADSEVRFDTVDQSQRRGIGQCSAGTPLDQAARGIPLPESSRIREGRTTKSWELQCALVRAASMSGQHQSRVWQRRRVHLKR